MSKQQQRTSQEIVLLTIREAANLLRLTTRTIRRWIAEGRLNARRTHPGRGGRLLLDRAEVLAAVGFSEALGLTRQAILGKQRDGRLRCPRYMRLMRERQTRE